MKKNSPVAKFSTNLDCVDNETLRQSLRILLIEDNPFDAEILTTLIHRIYPNEIWSEISIFHCDTILAAKALLLKESVDIIVLDLSLKDSSIPQTLDYLSELITIAPVIVSSGNYNQYIIKKIIHLGAEDCIPKFELNSRLLERTIGYALNRWRLKQDLIKTNQRLTNILWGTGVGTWEWNVLTGQALFNERCAEIIGYRLEELTSMPFDVWWKFIHDEDIHSAKKLLARHFSGVSNYFECEMRLRHKSGDWIWVLSRGKLISRANDTQPEWMVGTLLDITERKRIEEESAARASWQNAVLDFAGCSIISTAPDGTIQTFNPAAEKLLGYLAEEMIGKANLVFLHDHNEIVERARIFSNELGLVIVPGFEVLAVKSKLNLSNQYEWIFMQKNGNRVHVELTISALRNQSGDITGYLVIAVDITERKHNEQTLRLAQLVYQNTSEAIMIIDHNQCIVATNPAFTAVTGYEQEEVTGKHSDLLNLDNQDEHTFALSSTGHWHGETWHRKKSGEEYAARLSINTIFAPNGNVQHRVVLFSDITEKKKFNSLIWTQANYDSLTDLPNRRLFVDRLEQTIKSAKRDNFCIALFLIDLDHFKEINDTLGHHFGDALLIEVAKRIKNCLRESDTVARLGGDEFTVILQQLKNPSDAEHVAQNIIDVLTIPFHLGNEKVNISASIGITLCPDDGITITELLKNADQAMYAVKKNGRNGYHFFTSSMQEAATKRRKLAGMLREALHNDQFEAYFQPIIELKSGRIDKAEALLRWKTPEYGFVSPATFIPIAEDTGAIHDIGEWIFKEAIDEVIHCQKIIHPGFHISVNMSPVQFVDGSKTRSQWKSYLASKNLEHNSIVVEITEGLILDPNSNAMEKFMYFRDHGIEVAIDDFGTGYSSLAYLKKFDIDYLKIDQSFTKNLIPGNEDLALCEAIVVMAHKLGLKVIAEGIETEMQRDLLQKMGCDYGQGYLIAKPMPKNEFRAFVASHALKSNIVPMVKRKPSIKTPSFADR